MSTFSKMALWAGGVVLAVVSMASLAQAADAPKTLTIEGSTTVGPITDALAETFGKKYTDLKITVKNTGSGNGIKALIEGRCDIAASSRHMKPEEFKQAVEKGVMPFCHVVAMDGICMAVNPANTVLGLSTAQIRDIYTGDIKNWKAVGGPDMEIVVISRDTSSGTYEGFMEMVMAKKALDKNVQFVTGSKEVYDRVKTTKGAIGYVGLGFIDKDIKALNVDGVTPTKKTISSGKYPISRPLFWITNGYPALGGIAHEWVTNHLTEKGQKVVEAKGYVAVTEY